MISGLIRAVTLGLSLLHGASAYADTDVKLTTLPTKISFFCRGGRAKIYDECTDQRQLYEDARAEAASQGKVLLVSYGAEWCIWCHVYHAYLHGEADVFTHTYSDQQDRVRYEETIYERAETDVSASAKALKTYAAESFVLVHIDSRYAPFSDEALQISGAEQYFEGNLPFIFTVSANGKIAGVHDHEQVATRRDSNDWFRGYDRDGLLIMLQEMHAAAMAH